MPLLDPLHPIQGAIVEILGQTPGLKMADLHTQILAIEGLEVSLQNLYRTVGQMIDAQILVKEKGKHSLNFLWITHQMHFADMLRKNYIAAQGTSDLPEKDGDRREFYADSLADLDPLWNDQILRIKAFSSDTGFYEYISHPYFYLGKRTTESSFHEGMGEKGIVCYNLNGNDTFLDRYGNKLTCMEGVKGITKSGTGFPGEGYVLSVYGDFIIESVFPEAIARHFAVFFQTVHSIDQFDPELFASVFRMRSKCKLTVRRSKKEAQKLKDKIAAFFPVA